MKKEIFQIRYIARIYLILISKAKYLGLMLTFILILGCEKFLTPDLQNIARSDEIFKEWDEYRSAGLGLYALQQNLVDQLFVLGEVRADMLKLTQNSTAALEEVANFEFNPENEFMTPKGFYRVIAASNALAVKLEENQAELFQKADSVDYQDIPEYERNYLGLYGEVLCMRAWAYFNMVRIFGEVPYFPQHLATENEINDFVLSNPSKTFLNLDAVVDTFTTQLEDFIKDERVGVNYNSEGIDDPSWNVTTWNKWAYFALMGQMNLFAENYLKSVEFFEKIVYNSTGDYYFLNLKQYDAAGHNEDAWHYRPSNNNYWTNMYRTFDLDEHMFAVWFNKERKQQNRLQYFLSGEGVNIYALAPSFQAVNNWETQWHDATFVRDAVNPENMYMVDLGTPNDFIRGHGASYAYLRNGAMLTEEDIEYMLGLKQLGLFDEVENFMRGVDTVVYKYTIGKDPYDLDAHYSIFRAGPVHLYYAEALNASGSFRDAEDVINRGISFGTSSVSGVRRRAYLSLKLKINTDPAKDVEEGVEILDVMPVHDPYTNQITGFRNFAGEEKARLRDSLIIRELALESAWEGERFYDLIRVADRMEDPSFLADKVSSKFPADRRAEIRTILLNRENWYIPYFRQYK